MSTRVPTVESPFKAPEVRPEITPNVREHIDIPSNEDVNQRYAQGAEEVKKSAEDYMKQAQEHADFAVKNHYDAQLTLLSSNLLGKVKDYEGTNAFEAANPAVKMFDENVKSLRDGVTDQRQQQAIDNLSAEHRARLINDIGQHVATQTPKIDTEKFMVQRGAKLHDIGMNYNDPNAVQRNINDMYKSSDEAARLNHWTPEAIEKDRQAIHEGVLETIGDQKATHNQGYQIPKDLKDYRDSGKITEAQYDRFVEKYDAPVAASQAYQEYYGDKNEGIKGIVADKEKFFNSEGREKESALWDYVRKSDRFKSDDIHARKVYEDMMQFAKIDSNKTIQKKSDALNAWKDLCITTRHQNEANPDDPRFQLPSLIAQREKYRTVFGAGKEEEREMMGEIAKQAFTEPTIISGPTDMVDWESNMMKGKAGASELKDMYDSKQISVEDYRKGLDIVKKKNNGMIPTEAINNYNAAKQVIVNATQTDPKRQYELLSQLQNEVYQANNDSLIHPHKEQMVNFTGAVKFAQDLVKDEPGADNKKNPNFFRDLSKYGATAVPGEIGKWKMSSVPNYKIPLSNQEQTSRQMKFASNLKNTLGNQTQSVLDAVKYSNDASDYEKLSEKLTPILQSPEGIKAVQNAIKLINNLPPNEKGYTVKPTWENIQQVMMEKVEVPKEEEKPTFISKPSSLKER
jgi:hypothetical protein